jgi:hypothetical protein
MICKLSILRIYRISHVYSNFDYFLHFLIGTLREHRKRHGGSQNHRKSATKRLLNIYFPRSLFGTNGRIYLVVNPLKTAVVQT